MKLKILVTGAKGQLGTEIVGKLSALGQIIPTDKDELDFTNREETNEKITKEKPNIIVHVGAWTNVDGCAQEPEKALFINGEGTRNLTEAGKEVGAKFIYISTNEVFDGSKLNPYLEHDKPVPLTPYGKSKYQGEVYTKKLKTNWIIIRLSWLYGPASVINFPHKIINKAKQDGYLKVVDDEISTPTYTPDVADAISQLIQKNAQGIFHLINEGFASRYDWAKFLIENVGLKKTKLEAIKLKDFERASKPPSYTVLKNERAAALGISLRPWQEACKEYIATVMF